MLVTRYWVTTKDHHIVHDGPFRHKRDALACAEEYRDCYGEEPWLATDQYELDLDIRDWKAISRALKAEKL